MKKVIYLVMAVFGFTLTSCETVAPGHKGVEVSWGGETNMNVIYPEGMNSGLHWLWDEIVEYDVREKTIVHKFEFNDKNNMVTQVEVSLDYNLDPTKVNLLHTRITDIETKILKTLKSAGKEVVPQYSAVELNITKRTEAEQKLTSILTKEFPEFYVNFARVQMTDVDIPSNVAKLAEETAVQLGRNELASKLKAEKVAKAEALVAESKGKYEAAQFDVKTKELMSRPAVLALYTAETERIKWEGFLKHGTSPLGTHNFYGGNAPAIIKGIK